MASRSTYHTILKELIYHGLLPPKHEGLIPRTNVHRCRHDHYERYVGSEIRSIADKFSRFWKVFLYMGISAAPTSPLII